MCTDSSASEVDGSGIDHSQYLQRQDRRVRINRHFSSQTFISVTFTTPAEELLFLSGFVSLLAGGLEKFWANSDGILCVGSSWDKE